MEIDLDIERMNARLDFIESSSCLEYEASNEDKIIVFNDTDSCGISMSHLEEVLGIDVCHSEEDDKKSFVTPEGYDLVQECDDYINKEFTRWAIETFRSKNMMLNFKREKIIDKGIWTKKDGKDEEAKKNYIVHILDDEGMRHAKFKYTGVKFAKTTIPAYIKNLAKEIIEHLVLTEDKGANGAMVSSLYEKFKAMPIEEKSTIQRVKNLSKHQQSFTPPNTFNTADKVPGHVRCAIIYNWVIKELKLKQLPPIKNGDIVKIVELDSANQFGLSKIAYVDEWPKEFASIFTINEPLLFEKVIYKEIKRIYESIGWSSFNPSKNYVLNTVDLFGL